MARRIPSSKDIQNVLLGVRALPLYEEGWCRICEPPAVHDGWNTASARTTHDNFDIIPVGTYLVLILSSGERHGSCFVLGQPAAYDGTLFCSRPTTHPPTRGTLCLNCFPSFRVSPKKYGRVFFIKVICVAKLTSNNPMPTNATRDLAVCLPAPRSLDCAGGADVVCETTCRTNVGSFSNLEM